MKKYITILGVICLFVSIYFISLNIPMNKKFQNDTIKKYSIDIKAKYNNISNLDIYSKHGAIQFHYYLNNYDSQEIYNIFDDNYKLLFHDNIFDEIDDTKTMKAYIKIFFHVNTSNNSSNELLFKNTSDYDYRRWSVLENGILIKTISK